MIEVPNGFYRLSLKGLILNETRDKFLIVQEDNGLWELPGGGLDWGENPQDGLRREIEEEMGLKVTWVSKTPSYLIVGQKKKDDIWISNVIFEVTVENLDFTPSEECVAIRFVNSTEAKTLESFPNVQDLAEMFDPGNHQ
jgi:ADP-ribose pyrophosphatase YjhB (NUDIX family)